jgi:hypothetical protein
MSTGAGRILGRVRGQNAGLSMTTENRDDEQFHISPDGSQPVSFGLPDLVDIVRLGDSWQMMGAASTGLTAVPTTAGLLTLWNGEPGNGKIYAIDSVAATKVIIDVSTNDYFTLWCQIIRSPMAAPTDAALARVSLCGKSNYAGRARNVASSTTLSNRWDNLGNSPTGAPAIAGSAWTQTDVNVLGRYIVTPGAAFTVSASEITNTASTFRFTIRWHEIQIPYV